MNTHDYFEIADSEMPWEEKLAAYEALVDDYYDTQHGPPHWHGVVDLVGKKI